MISNSRPPLRRVTTRVARDHPSADAVIPNFVSCRDRVLCSLVTGNFRHRRSSASVRFSYKWKWQRATVWRRRYDGVITSWRLLMMRTAHRTALAAIYSCHGLRWCCMSLPSFVGGDFTLQPSPCSISLGNSSGGSRILKGGAVTLGTRRKLRGGLWISWIITANDCDSIENAC